MRLHFQRGAMLRLRFRVCFGFLVFPACRDNFTIKQGKGQGGQQPATSNEQRVTGND
jgi:hypothetical protein